MSALMPEDEDLLELARQGFDASDRDHARVKRKLFSQLGVATMATTAVSASQRASAGLAGSAATSAGKGAVAAGAKLAIALFVGAGAATGVVTAYESRTRGGIAPAREMVTAISSSVEVVDPSRIEPASSSPSQPETPSSPMKGPAPGRATLRDRTTGDRASSSTRTVDALPSAPARPDDPRVALPVAAPIPAEPGGPSTVGAETELLRDADRALKAGDPSRALVLLHDHATRFSQGILQEERDAERIVVLCALGRTQEARELAASFLRDRPRSPLAPRVRDSCGGS